MSTEQPWEKAASLLNENANIGDVAEVIHTACEEHAANVLKQNEELQAMVLREKNVERDALKLENERFLTTIRHYNLCRQALNAKEFEDPVDTIKRIVTERDTLLVRVDQLETELREIANCTMLDHLRASEDVVRKVLKVVHDSALAVFLGRKEP